MKVVHSSALSGEHDPRYVVIDETTGQVLDDAQGYGYKTAANAHRGYAHKQLPARKKRQRQKEAAARRKEADNPELAEAYLRAYKDGGDTDAWAAGVLHAAGIHRITDMHGADVPVLPPALKSVGDQR